MRTRQKNRLHRNFITRIGTLAEQNGELPQKQVFILIVCLTIITSFTSRTIQEYADFWSTGTWIIIGWCLALGGSLAMFLVRIKIRKHKMFYFSIAGFFMFHGVYVLVAHLFDYLY